ncbi:MAG: ABC transporter permease [Bacillaceae bacterium]
MMGLIRNELMKIFGKKASWVYIIIILASLLISATLYNKFSEVVVNNWAYMNSVVIGLSSLVTLFVVITCSANVSAEFSDGTIKQLLIRPHRRWSVLLSKYIAVIIYAAVLLATLYIVGYIVSLLFFGNGDFNMTVNEPTLEGTVTSAVGSLFFTKLLYSLPGLLMIMTISFMLSTLFKSQSLAVGVGIFVLFLSNTLAGIILLLAKKYAIAKLLIFPYLDLTFYATQDTLLDTITLPIALAILAVYYIIFMAITFVFFQKRDISI